MKVWFLILSTEKIKLSIWNILIIMPDSVQVTAFYLKRKKGKRHKKNKT